MPPSWSEHDKNPEEKITIISNFQWDVAERPRFDPGHQVHSMISYIHHKYMYIVCCFLLFWTLNNYALGHEFSTEKRGKREGLCLKFNDGNIKDLKIGWTYNSTILGPSIPFLH
jgi:hypothetical protein